MKNLSQILSGQPAFRMKQIHAAWFDLNINNYGEITTLSKEMREKLKNIPWLSVKLKMMQESKLDDTKKALLELVDGEIVETVLMGREDKKENSEREKRYTICISSQVGCPMGCKFCATGMAGFKRNLSVEEIVDQVRFWQKYLSCHSRESGNPVVIASAAKQSHPIKCHSEAKPKNPPESKGILRSAQDDNKKIISNIVLMGQGEPFLNYENVKEALRIILENTEIGPSKITVSTVGIPAMLEKMLEDKNFPAVRLAISLHSAIDKDRSKIIPSSPPNFISFLTDWSKKYHARFTSRALFLGLEYTMLDGINDDDKHLKALIKLASNVGRVRINLIPYNSTVIARSEATWQSLEFEGSPPEKIASWHNKLLKTGFVCTIRRSQGQDIAAACGQLRNLNVIASVAKQSLRN